MLWVDELKEIGSPVGTVRKLADWNGSVAGIWKTDVVGNTDSVVSPPAP